MELVFAYLAGLLTLINPCVLPVLPIVLAGAIQASRLGPLVLAAGMSLSFVVLGVGITAFGHTIGLTQDIMAQIGAYLMVGFGLIMLVPQFSTVFSSATAGMAAGADMQMNTLDHTSLQGQFLGGMLLGAVWSPCIGPTLGGAISLASQGENLWFATLIMIAFALGVSTLIIALGYGARKALQGWLRKIAENSRPVMGLIFIAVGLMILLRVHHMLEAWAVQNLPVWLIDLSVSI